MEPERPDGADGKPEQQAVATRAKGVGVLEKARAQGLALKERAEAEAKTYKDPQQTQLWKSIFRVSHDRSDPRNRSLASRISRHMSARTSGRTTRTWCERRVERWSSRTSLTPPERRAITRWRSTAGIRRW